MSNLCLALFVDSSPTIPWSVTCLQMSETFLESLNQLRAGWREYFSEFIPKLSNCRLVKTFVGREKLNLVAVDYHLRIDEVCKKFGYFVRFNCTKEEAQRLSVSLHNEKLSENAFLIFKNILNKDFWLYCRPLIRNYGGLGQKYHQKTSLTFPF